MQDGSKRAAESMRGDPSRQIEFNTLFLEVLSDSYPGDFLPFNLWTSSCFFIDIRIIQQVEYQTLFIAFPMH
jgi:hypothetical protein